jgi:hypothetical protein
MNRRQLRSRCQRKRRLISERLTIVAVLRSLRAKSLPLTLCIGILSLCGLVSAQNTSRGQQATPSTSAQISFNALKSLAGTWTGRVTTDPRNPEIDGAIQVTMRVASRGNVLVHEIAPGGVPEPTAIYLESDRLTLVHYCEAGNRPRMVARKSPDQKTVEFDFVDISGSTNLPT